MTKFSVLLQLAEAYVYYFSFIDGVNSEFSGLALFCDKTDNALTGETLHFAEYLSNLLAHVFRIMNY